MLLPGTRVVTLVGALVDLGKLLVGLSVGDWVLLGEVLRTSR